LPDGKSEDRRLVILYIVIVVLFFPYLGIILDHCGFRPVKTSSLQKNKIGPLRGRQLAVAAAGGKPEKRSRFAACLRIIKGSMLG
jgi:hypothetical protein